MLNNEVHTADLYGESLHEIYIDSSVYTVSFAALINVCGTLAEY